MLSNLIFSKVSISKCFLNYFKKHTNAPINDNSFNLYALSLYQDNKQGTLKFIAANFNSNQHDDSSFSLEGFEYEPRKHCLVHTNTYAWNLGEICDLVVAEDNGRFIYLSQCESRLSHHDFSFKLEFKRGQIYLLDTLDKHVYTVARNLFMPKSLAYIKVERVLVVSNLARNGISLYKREFDNSLTWLRDIDFNAFVFNIFIDIEANIWLSMHTSLHETLSLNTKETTSTFTSSQLVRVKLDCRYSQYVDYEVSEIFTTNGHRVVNALSASLVHKNSYILFSLLSEPSVCSFL